MNGYSLFFQLSGKCGRCAVVSGNIFSGATKIPGQCAHPYTSDTEEINVLYIIQVFHAFFMSLLISSTILTAELGIAIFLQFIPKDSCILGLCKSFMVSGISV